MTVIREELDHTHGQSSRTCPSCASDRCKVLHSQRFVLPQNHPLFDGYDVVSCDRCGFVYADSTVTQQDYDVYYADYSHYEDNTVTTGGGGTPYDDERLRETAACLASVVSNRESSILELGCANGGLLSHLEQIGFKNLCGVDPSRRCVQHLTTQLGIKAHVGSLFDLPEGLVSDLVILSHVLEHIHDLRRAAEILASLVGEGGMVYLEVPDAIRYPECLVAPFQDFNTEHINHFSYQSMSNLMTQFPFEEVLSGGKTLVNAGGTPYPATFGFFRRVADRPATSGPIKDTVLRERIIDYINLSRTMMETIDSKLQAVLAENNRVIIWGTGQLAMKLLAETSLAHAEILAFVDGNRINQGKVLMNVPIRAPREIIGSQDPIIVTSILHQQEILKVIREDLGLTNSVILLS